MPKPLAPAELRALLARLPEHPCAVQAGKTLAYALAERDRGNAENAKRLLRRAAAWLEDAR
jgi:hypothetical protein